MTADYQKKAPVLAAISGATWAPIPDEIAYVVRQMFLAKAFRYVGSARENNEYQKAMQDIGKALGHDDSEASEEYVTPEFPLMGGY
jgi:hypothetical protein